ncbi:hypothetical protein G5I_13183 [Acromyrmex echinatior]|uniref:Uncharacterized protein n=1 Tax=Acromyrmex echinatior TaxID=103372 RepID=F4X4C3_ACREC|nr:hypothetical protein G5I_13183 [Acromyrmex echinatior]
MVILTLCTSSRLVLFLSIMNKRAWPSGCSSAWNRCQPVRESFALPISELTLLPARQVDRLYIEIIKKFFRRLSNYHAEEDQIIREFRRRNFQGLASTAYTECFAARIPAPVIAMMTVPRVAHGWRKVGTSREPSYRSIPRRGIDTVTRPRVSRHADTSQNPCNELPPSLSASTIVKHAGTSLMGKTKKIQDRERDDISRMWVTDPPQQSYSSSYFSSKGERWIGARLQEEKKETFQGAVQRGDVTRGEGKGGSAEHTPREKKTWGRESKSEMETGSAQRGSRDTGGGSGGRRTER